MADETGSTDRSDGSPAPGAESDDKTVISSGPLLAPRTSPAGLSPQELGRALVGQKLDQLVLEEFIGGGGMGAVFRAVDTKLDRTVAVKVLSTLLADDTEMERRFQVEAQSAARLDHPNIARIHYVGEDQGVAYIVFEYIEGMNVRDLVGAHGPLRVADALKYTLEIADALAHAWQRDVVHRDIKPSNILITREGHAKLVDMGLARLEQVDQSEMTATGVTLGTFDYISPEQARDPRSADTRSDIYSLGCTMFFMLTGQPPFFGGTALQKLLQHQGERPPDLRPLRPDVPDVVADVVATMLAKRVEDRFQNPIELVSALVAINKQLGLGSSYFTVHPAWTAPPPRRAWLRHTPWLVPLLLLPLGVVAIETFWEAPPPSTPFMDSVSPTGQDIVNGNSQIDVSSSADGNLAAPGTRNADSTQTRDAALPDSPPPSRGGTAKGPAAANARIPLTGEGTITGTSAADIEGVTPPFPRLPAANASAATPDSDAPSGTP